jgi:hypothetical protein
VAATSHQPPPRWQPTAAQVLVATLLNALAPLLDVLLLCSFVFLVFGLIGLQVFAGALRFR